ncbi:endonuclease/exonuclease/phosphatase family protein [Solicola sp. PLA-1-18]|uniref:endonuclease/exonuclease/phosphatase family protein n=1 Tax=Solicola sp. PLA-1-18 TaxID=3380532 RepID=UPI003B779B90
MIPTRHLLALVATLLLLGTVAAPAGAHPRPEDRPEHRPGSTLVQMNLCLSGLAGCFGRTAYPAVLDEAVARIDQARADAVTLNEACSGDVASVARRTGLHARFSTVLYRGAPLECRTPTGRGVFGNAVLTRDPVVAWEDRAYEAQAGVEERRWACATTSHRRTTCVTHLSTAGAGEPAAANEAQCVELGRVLERRARAGERVWFAGDVNRRPSCAPRGFTTLDDAAATQAPGIQHAYVHRSRGRATGTVVAARYTDHDVLVVRARH